ncbi:MAG TPA: CHRD domain-containing protein [Gemmatimonadales bacterium]|nr:CHRD domain-containing protein [Gemmatimonadales bacterium]
MRGRLVFGVGTVAVVLALGSCKDDVGVTVSERFMATLSGASSRPTPITTTATGTAEFTYVADLATLFYRIDVGSLDSVTLAHIHAPADTGSNAGVVLNLFLGPTKGPGFSGTLAQGVGGDLGAPAGMTMDSLLVLLRNGHAYVNVHTRAHPAGEIRGQVVKQ